MVFITGRAILRVVDPAVVVRCFVGRRLMFTMAADANDDLSKSCKGPVVSDPFSLGSEI
jgi:hypothetical protein